MNEYFCKLRLSLVVKLQQDTTVWVTVSLTIMHFMINKVKTSALHIISIGLPTFSSPNNGALKKTAPLDRLNMRRFHLIECVAMLVH